MSAPQVDIKRPSTKDECDEVVRFLAANMKGALLLEHQNLLLESARGSADTVVFASWENGVVVGFVCLKFEPYRGTYLAAYITFILVRGAKQPGCAHRLMQAAEDAARERTDQLWVSVIPTRRRWGSRFFGSRGYRAIGGAWLDCYSKALRATPAEAVASGGVTGAELLRQLSSAVAMPVRPPRW